MASSWLNSRNPGAEIVDVSPAALANVSGVDLNQMSGGVVDVTLADGTNLTTDTVRLENFTRGRGFSGFRGASMTWEPEADKRRREAGQNVGH